MAIMPLGGGDKLVTPEVPAPVVEEPTPEVPSFVTIALADVVWEWIEESLETAPPASQLHFSLHLRTCLDALEEKFRALA